MTVEERSLRDWIDHIPSSRMVYPKSARDRFMYFGWRLLTPLHPHLRDILMWLGVIRHHGRQDYLLGKIALNSSIQDLIAFLVEKGYGNHFVALEDEGELVSLRYARDFQHQYHIRVFQDGEVRAHYEYTPECHPILHMRSRLWESKNNEFLSLLEDRIIPA